ncbi:MAG: hypothetical protein K6F82_05410 [Sphaerochaetaceae bacterium]|nr:hypothetical protein [Sphaerochaetaceae bacterium]
MKRSIIGNIVRTICFIAVFIVLFIILSYILRQHGYDWEHIAGIKNEKPLDVIYVGGSNTFVYWQPLKAFNDYGITSFDMATNSAPADHMLYYIKEAQKYHAPKLVIIEGRSLLACGTSEGGFRNGSDAMSYSINRTFFIHSYIKRNGVEASPIYYYLDLFKYHTQYSSILDRDHWENMFNSPYSKYKGWKFIYSYSPIERPELFLTEECATLSEKHLNCLIELFDYCRNQDFEVLITVSPYAITKDDFKILNAIEILAGQYGFSFLNTNLSYDEMNIDFSNDFYNIGHVNVFGAEKYTDFLSNYINDNYSIPDHRDDKQYSTWFLEYEEFKEEEYNVKKWILEQKEKNMNKEEQ